MGKLSACFVINGFNLLILVKDNKFLLRNGLPDL